MTQTTGTKGINPKATLKPLAANITPELLEGYRAAGIPTDAWKAHVADCIKSGDTPVPAEDWVHCPHPACSYCTPNSLVSHIKSKHTSVAALANELSALTGELIFPEQIQLVSEAAQAKYRAAGAKGAAGAKAKAEARKAAEAATA